MRRIIGQLRKARAAFTLMEVNLAVFIMAVGVLAMASLYPLGFRESQQSRDDVRAAITAEEVLGKLTAALSSRNIEWKQWRDNIKVAVEVSNDGWFSYFRKKGGSYQVMDKEGVNKLADEVFNALAKAAGVDIGWDRDSNYSHGLVVQWGKRIVDGIDCDDYSRVSISFRMSRRSGALMTAPLYYTEVHFQGDFGDQGSKK